ncbi:uncharacterized protein LOC132715625 [Ruditapes philippinarum]|uniref:uncharacterized protein LOC132715625 n=1 Tax=Ruditapes philippinarum TaxID=129788 RepID=UPI00295BC777|nr:uncharacterized protein LOC132715625 [Ruditapes philippinarum]
MACVLSMYTLNQNQFKENVTDIHNIGLTYLDFNWINNIGQQSDFLENHIYCGQYENDRDTPKLCRLEVANDTVQHDPFNIISNSRFESQVNTIVSDAVSDKQDLTNGSTDLNEKTEMCVQLDITKNGVKRKAIVSGCDEEYIPSKRVSPFLNTPKERKDERKNILKISVNKIKKLDDPEIFLRRSVLVNNLTKRLQTELRQEKQSSRKFSSYRRKCFSDYKVLNNSCLSDTYLEDDPFLSGTHEAITDDMTDTLINNVLNDNKSNEVKEDHDSW